MLTSKPYLHYLYFLFHKHWLCAHVLPCLWMCLCVGACCMRWCSMCVVMPEYVSSVYAFVCISVCVSGYKVTLIDWLYRDRIDSIGKNFENSQGPHFSGDSWSLCGLLPPATIQGVPLPLYLSFSYCNFMCSLQPCPWQSKIRMSRQVSGKETPGSLVSWQIPCWLWWHDPAP